MESSYKSIAQRMVNADNAFVAAIMEISDVSRADAFKVLWIVKARDGAIPAATSHLSWEVIIDGDVYLFASKRDAETWAISATSKL